MELTAEIGYRTLSTSHSQQKHTNLAGARIRSRSGATHGLEEHSLVEGWVAVCKIDAVFQFEAHIKPAAKIHKVAEAAFVSSSASDMF